MARKADCELARSRVGRDERRLPRRDVDSAHEQPRFRQRLKETGAVVAHAHRRTAAQYQNVAGGELLAETALELRAVVRDYPPIHGWKAEAREQSLNAPSIHIAHSAKRRVLLLRWHYFVARR